MTRAKNVSRDSITYICDLANGGQRKLTVPSNWKATFGATVPWSEKGRMNISGERGCAFRLYEGNKTNLRMMFTDVVAFRDASIVLEEKVTKTQQQTVRKQTAAGAKDFVVEAKFTQWVDPDKPVTPDKEFLTLPTLSDLRDAEDLPHED
jgi:hypothetical protein